MTLYDPKSVHKRLVHRADIYSPPPSRGEGEGGGERPACPPHPDLPPRRGEGNLWDRP